MLVFKALIPIKRQRDTVPTSDTQPFNYVITVPGLLLGSLASPQLLVEWIPNVLLLRIKDPGTWISLEPCSCRSFYYRIVHASVNWCLEHKGWTGSCVSVPRYEGLHRTITLSDNDRLSLPVATWCPVWADGSVGCVNTVSRQDIATCSCEIK